MPIRKGDTWARLANAGHLRQIPPDNSNYHGAVRKIISNNANLVRPVPAFDILAIMTVLIRFAAAPLVSNTISKP
jgi:hypothetical protein